MKIGDWCWFGISRVVVLTIKEEFDYRVNRLREVASVRHIGGMRVSHDVPVEHLKRI